MKRICRSAVLLLAGCLLSQAALLTSITDVLTTGDPTMLGRTFRNGVPSDWSALKAFPGVTGASNTYFYDIYVIAITNTPYIQISVDDPAVAVFTTAYWGSFVPAPGPTATGYLGDPGSSGNIFGNPRFFQVIAPGPGNLVLMVSNTLTSGGGLGNQFNILVEGFLDTMYTDPAPVPEPMTAALAGVGFAAIVLIRRRAGKK